MSALAHGAVYGLAIVVTVLTVVALGVWFERKFAGRMQSRLGPTMVGPIGLLQSVADVVKLLQKEDIVPRDADPRLFTLAPVLAGALALGAAAVVPFSASVVAADLDGFSLSKGTIRFQTDQPVPDAVLDRVITLRRQHIDEALDTPRPKRARGNA
jgi:NADH:ubiquinone oxidoreductase subunit H